MVDPATFLFCPHARPAGDYCPHCPPARPSAVEIARRVLEGREADESDARQQLHLAERHYVDGGRQPSDVRWMAEARLAYELKRRLAFEAREQLRKAEVAEAEEARRR